MRPAGWFSTSGGVIYHLRALRYRHTRWRDFRSTVAGWIAAWQPPCRQVLLIGPSAGHTLPAALFGRFEQIIALEPDPLARWLLRRRATAARLSFAPLDVLSDARELALLPQRYPQAAVLFCNVLGQIPAPAGLPWQAHLGRELSSMHWASFHDVIATSRTPRRDAPREHRARAERLESVLGRFWPGGELEVHDHATFALAGDGLADYTVWPLGRARYHLIEWVSHAPASAA